MKAVRLLLGIVVLGLGFFVTQPVVAQGGASASKGPVVIGMIGGLNGENLRRIINGFAQKNGFEVAYVEGASNDLLAKVRAQKDNPQMDLFIAGDQSFGLAKSLGLIAKVDRKFVPNIDSVDPKYRDPDGYGQGYEVNVVGISYNTRKFSEAGIPAPTSWADFTNPKLKGRALIYTPTVILGLHLIVGLAQSQGKDENDISAAWPLLTKVVENSAVVATSPGQAENLFSSGEAWMYVNTASRASFLKDKGAPMSLAIPKEGAIVYAVFLVPVANSKNPENAQRILNHFLSKEVQEGLTKTSAVMPVRRDVELNAEQKARLGIVGNQMPKTNILNVDVVNKNLDTWLDRFNRTVSR